MISSFNQIILDQSILLSELFICAEKYGICYDFTIKNNTVHFFLAFDK
ncbi:Uncharacterized protein dnm_060050 [Desulfonema magnum]|uniref:Uncharacterized protein n=1 Tax=Desulfonema magnum TaxID=45655 RepID=A0A975BQU1_9BACT|nr:Uncharacterized protein dnm_060050 [Desulfonema magnum]